MMFLFFLWASSSGDVHPNISTQHKDVDGVLIGPSWSLPSAVAFW